MESRIRVLLLIAASSLLGGCAGLHGPFHRAVKQDPQTVAAEKAAVQRAEDPGAPTVVIEPRVERRAVKVPQIDTENFEIGGFYGQVSIEDFGAVPVHGLRADYHISEDFFLEAAAGKARGGKTSYETLGGKVQLLSDRDRQFTFYNLALGYNFLPGEVFIGRNRVLASGLYLLGGIGSTRFAGDQHFTANFGAGFRVLPTDWLAIHMDAQDLIFRSDLLGVDRLKNNLQIHLGASVFF